jgi:type II secretory pathway pseudopilin PulG
MRKKTMPLLRTLMLTSRRESGITFLETIVSLAILGTIAVTFLSGLAITSQAIFIADEHTTAESLARSQMEWVRNTPYVYDATTYSAAPIPGGKDYVNYTVAIAAEPLHATDDGIQKITVTVKHSDKSLIELGSYKVDR